MAFYISLITSTFLNIALLVITSLTMVLALQCHHSPCTFPTVVPSTTEGLQEFFQRETPSNDLNPIMDSHLTDSFSPIQDEKKIPLEPNSIRHIPDYMFQIYNQKIHKSAGGNIFDNVRIYRASLGKM